MKKSLPIAVYLCAYLLSVCQHLHAQIKGGPVLKAVAANQPFIEKKSIRLSQDLQTMVAANNPAAGTMRTLSSGAPFQPVSGFNKSIVTKDHKVLVNMTLKTGSKISRNDLTAMGLEITATYGRMISGYISINDLPQFETGHEIRFVRAVYKLKSQLQIETASALATRLNNFNEPVVSQGDVAQRSDIARQKYKVTGKDVKVGILSDSYNTAGATNIGIESGELPGTVNPYGSKNAVQVLQDSYTGGTDEGRAMAEIVHDVAPNAELAFHSASFGQANFARGIQDLANIGCRIIVDDALYPDEPFFQNGVVAQAINAVKKKGVSYFSAAGNKGNLSYESEYRPSQFSPFSNSFITGTAHNFNGPGDPPNYFQPISIPINNTFITSFQWSQPFFSAGGLGAETDMDIFLLDANGTIVAESLDDNISSGDPVEILSYVNNTPSNIFYVTILKFQGPDPARLKYVNFGDDMSFFVPTPAIPGVYAPALVGHPNAEGAIAVGAANYATTPAFGITPPQAEFYSSEGGVARYFDDQGYPVSPVVRKKPEIIAPDGGNTSFFYTDSRQDIDEYPNFFGTSASAAHVAGAAALMMEAQKLKTITPDQVKGILTSKAVDMDNANTIGFDVGFDFKTGAGLIQADAAVDAVRFPKVYIKNLQIKSVCSDNPSASRNWKVTNPNPFEVEAHWFLAGFPQYGTVIVQPGDTVLTSNTGYLSSKEVSNIVVLEWEDNFGFPRLGIALSTRNDCTNQSLAANGQPGEVTPDMVVKPDIAEAFPNPFSRSFRVYLSFANRQDVQMELFGVDGKQLTRKTVPSEGVVNMDATGYKPGMYYLKVTGINFSKTIQLIKL